MLHFTLRCIAKTDRFVCFTLMILSLLVKQSLYKIRFHHDESTSILPQEGFILCIALVRCKHFPNMKITHLQIFLKYTSSEIDLPIENNQDDKKILTHS